MPLHSITASRKGKKRDTHNLKHGKRGQVHLYAEDWDTHNLKRWNP